MCALSESAEAQDEKCSSPAQPLQTQCGSTPNLTTLPHGGSAPNLTTLSQTVQQDMSGYVAKGVLVHYASFAAVHTSPIYGKPHPHNISFVQLRTLIYIFGLSMNTASRLFMRVVAHLFDTLHYVNDPCVGMCSRL